MTEDAVYNSDARGFSNVQMVACCVMLQQNLMNILPVVQFGYVLHATAALFEPVFRFVDDEAFLVPCLIPLVWWGFPLFYHDCFMSAGRTMMHHCKCTLPGLARNATEGASSSSMGFPAGRVFGMLQVLMELGNGRDAAAFVSCCWKPWAAVVVAVGSGFDSCSG
ncbi:hypothetical protein Nepgr_029683 [Nepenthes gracilis]|uniref:Uncharacterized protein n=1 Tax=Nepenthes gracilis TaxID=150966 RepID=A0AAD3Y529_NEPGR|nr:hypothetical protein Nepgr_029683 [Nepenthes gracilis]